MFKTHFVFTGHGPGLLLLAVVVGLLVVAIQPSQAQTETVLYTPDGATPFAGLVRNAKGNLYGTTLQGGITSGYGTVFEVTPSRTEKVLHSFTGGTDGIGRWASLVMGKKSTLYGTTQVGGLGYGTVFAVTSSGKESIILNFDGLHGAYLYAGLIRDSAGNLYGTTPGGGLSSSGTVFELTASGTEQVLYNFTGGADGDCPLSMLVRDAAGNLYGTTEWGGAYGYGTVFKLTASGTEQVLYSFAGGSDGAYPYAGVVRDSKGNLYGTTTQGGAYNYGTVFQVSAAGAEKILHSLGASADGISPEAGLIRDSMGNLYGTTYQGGAYNYGTVFKVTKKGVEQVLYSFTGGADGRYPFSNLIRDAAGNLYGTTGYGGIQNCAYGDGGGCGTVFMVTP